MRKLPEWLRGVRIPPNQAILVSGQPVCQGAGVSVPEYYSREHCGSVPYEPQWGNPSSAAFPASIANLIVYKGECGAVARCLCGCQVPTGADCFRWATAEVATCFQ